MGRRLEGREKLFEVEMPELPEVETIAKQLNHVLAGKKIVGLDVRNGKSFLGLRDELLGVSLESITRRAKLLIFSLDGGKYMLFHLKMTGQLIYLDKNTRIVGGHADHDWHAKLPNAHTRIVFEFEGGQKLFFNDLRAFGWCKVMTKTEMEAELAKYGPEPLPRIDVQYLKSRAERMGRSMIKKFLMDQNVIAGIGNIYADEILFASKIHPKRLVSSISEAEWVEIVKNVEQILKLAIEKGGTTDSDYVNAHGERGGMQDYLAAYHRTGLPCVRKCGGKIERIVVGGRGTHYCPVCQKENV